MSVDLWIERVACHAKVILVRLIGGADWWRYGVERLAATARTHGIKLALLPGEDRDDPRLAEASTLPPDELAVLLALFPRGRARQPARLAAPPRHHAGAALEVAAPQPLPRLAAYLPGEGAVDVARLAEVSPPGRPVVAIIFYRALLLAADTSPLDALCAELAARGLAPAPLAVTSLKEAAAAEFVRTALAGSSPRIVTTTAFAAGGEALAADAVRRHRRAGAPGHYRDHEARGLARQRRAASAPPISPCMWCCRSSTAACSPAPSRSRTRCRPTSGLPSRRSPTGRSRTGSTRSRTASRRWRGCGQRRAANAASPS